MEVVGGAEQMRTLSLSSPLPLCNGVVVLDERPPVKGNGLGLSGRLLVNGCGRGGERERERGDSEDEITPINETEGSLMGAGGNGVRANGGGRKGRARL